MCAILKIWDNVTCIELGLFNKPKRKLRKMLNSGDYAEALEFGETIEPKYENDPDFLFIIGSAHYILGDSEKSLSYFERALEINSHDMDSLLLSARVFVYLKNNDEARRRCERILDIDVEHTEAQELFDSLS